ncbi:helix-turn-helix domain-containing protein [Gordonia sp. ABSL11-1]|uniref:helix-turn-helix domain-containing protein n=1 Tax=Gordonia sp. ABSL11-1 TaxID=3053924 RepID=UPI0025722D88|nr:helix-turn-helix domain-containing protein [Gordonia sp. ABSL11-1]MDL9944556.1 helix-turn-helix domain-containing protein [Gordonia sp. ABSL11-1]
MTLRDGDDVELERILRSTTAPAGAVKRVGIVALAAEGMANSRIQELTAASSATVVKWRNRYLREGLAGLVDAERSGRPRAGRPRRDRGRHIEGPPKRYGVSHWSSRLLARHLKIGNATVA